MTGILFALSGISFLIGLMCIPIQLSYYSGDYKVFERVTFIGIAALVLCGILFLAAVFTLPRA